MIFYKPLLIVLFAFTFLKADIVYNGSCGNYDYNITTETNKYYGCMCDGSKLLVYENSKKAYIRGLYFDVAVSNSYDIYSLSNYKVLKSYDFEEGQVKLYDIESFYYELLFALTGLLLAYMIISLFIRAII